jgi:putative spermidine/putrescine transport system permease protein
MERVHRGMRLSPTATSWLQVGPLAFVLGLMVVVPFCMMFVVSFCDYGFAEVYPDFMLDNYRDLFTSSLTLGLYGKTFQFVLMTWAVTLVVGFLVSYFVMFHVRTRAWRTGLLLACAIPFWTSTIIRMISWIPFLGREGIVNSALMQAGIITQPLTFLLYSEFSVVLAYVHIMTMMMVAPIANSMAKIDGNIIAAARDAGASEWQIVTNIVIPLCKSGMALGSVFIITQVIGDFFVVKLMSGSQVATAVGAISNELTAFQYPPAAAGSVLMMLVVVAIVALILRVVDIRKELTR